MAITEFKEQVLRYKDRIVFIKLSMPYFSRTLKEYAENEACFMFVNQGEVAVRGQEDYLKLNPKMGMLAKCLNYFFEPTTQAADCNNPVESIGIFLYPSLVEEIFEFDLSTSNHQSTYNLKQIPINQLLENYKASIGILLDHPELADAQIIKTKIKEFVLLISKLEQAPSQLDFLAGLFKPQHSSFASTIQHNLYVNLSLEELAALCHLSLSSFKRKFQEVFDESPKKYLNRKKIERAAQLLQSEEYRISDIAFDVGFDSITTFNRNFQSIYAISPSAYRLNQNDQPLT